MSTDIFFSIVVPTLNEEGCVTQLLSDLVHQTFRSFEVMHVDGRSTDRTCDEVLQFANTLLLRQFTSKRRNLSHQRNMGAREARGTYIIFADADTRLQDRDTLSRIYTHCMVTHADVLLPQAVFENSSCIAQLAQWINNTAVRALHRTRMAMPSSGLAIFRRAFFESIGGYLVSGYHDKESLFAEDQEIMDRTMSSRARVRYLDDVRYSYSTRRYDRDGWVLPLIRIVVVSVCRLARINPPAMTYRMGGQG